MLAAWQNHLKNLKKKYYCLVSTPKDKIVDLERALGFVNAPLVSLLAAMAENRWSGCAQ